MQDKFQKRIQDMMKTKSNADAERESAIASAIEKTKAEFEKAGATDSSEESKRHEEELRALEEKLQARHEEELRSAIENARPEQGAATTDQQAAIDAAVVEQKAAWESTHAVDIEAAVDRGRMEAAAKSKLKDNQLVKAQRRVKELEAQALKWKEAGYIPEEEQPPVVPAAPSPAPTAPAATSASASAPGQTGSSSTLPTAPAAGAGAGARKPGQPPTVPGAAGRGAPIARQQRGSLLASRGGAPARPIAPLSIAGASSGATSTANQPGTLNIMGASKRPRDEQSGTGDDTLAKRLRPAAEAPSKPAAMQQRLRPPPQQQTQPPTS
jgi:nucleoprotein TPR